MAETPTTEEIRLLAESHMRLYTSRIEQAQNGAKYVNILQTAHYLGLWKSITEKGCQWDALTNAERNEIVDALSSRA